MHGLVISLQPVVVMAQAIVHLDQGYLWAHSFLADGDHSTFQFGDVLLHCLSLGGGLPELFLQISYASSMLFDVLFQMVDTSSQLALLVVRHLIP